MAIGGGNMSGSVIFYGGIVLAALGTFLLVLQLGSMRRRKRMERHADGYAAAAPVAVSHGGGGRKIEKAEKVQTENHGATMGVDTATLKLDDIKEAQSLADDETERTVMLRV